MAASGRSDGPLSPLEGHELPEIENAPVEAATSLSAPLLSPAEADLAQTLASARCKDFKNPTRVALGANGMVLSVTCTLPGVDPGRVFALKVVFNWGQPTEAACVAYRNEFEVLERLRPHPHITRFWSEFVEEMPPFVVNLLPPAIRSLSQAVDPRTGQSKPRKAQFLLVDYHPATLKAHLAALPRPLAPAYWARYMRDLARAMQFLHNHNVVHLDLKLDNLLVSISDRVVLCDFGTAMRLGAAMSWGFAPHTGVSPGGNVPHIAPEVLNAHTQCRRMDPDDAPGQRIPCGATELWAVGCLAHEMATGHHPFPSYPDAFGGFRGLVHYEASDIPGLPADYPEPLRVLVSRMLSLDPEERPGWGEVVSAFEAAVDVNSQHTCADPAAKAAGLVVSVKSMMGRVAAVEVPEGATVGQVCAAAAVAHNQEPVGLALLYRGQLLDSDQPVTDLQLQAESVVYMVPQVVAVAPPAGPAVAVAAAGGSGDEDDEAEEREEAEATGGAAAAAGAVQAGPASIPDAERPGAGSQGVAAAGGGSAAASVPAGGRQRVAALRQCVTELQALIPQGEKLFPAARKDVDALLRRVADTCSGRPGEPAAKVARVAGVDAGLVLLLASLLAGDEPPIAAALALAQLCRHPRAKVAAVEAGVVPSLVALLDQGEEAAAAAAEALCHIARDSEGLRPSGWWNFVFAARELREVVASAGAVPKLAERLARGDPDSAVVAAATAALRELAVGSVTRVNAMVSVDVLPSLVGLLTAPRPETVAAAVGVLRLVCAAGDSQLEAVIAADALPVLVDLLHSQQQGVAGDAARALLSVAQSSSRVGSMWNSIVGSNQFRQALVDAGALPPLVQLLETGRLATIAAQTLDATARGSDELERAVVGAGAIERFVPLLSSPQDAAVEAAIAGLGTLSRKREHQQLLLDAGGLPAVVRLLGASYGNSDAGAAVVVANLCKHASLRRQVVDAGALPGLVALISAWGGKASSNAIEALASISQHPDLVPAVIETGALPALRRPVRQVSLSALALVERVSNGTRDQKLAVVGAGLLPELVHGLGNFLGASTAGKALFNLIDVVPWMKDIPGLKVGFGQVVLAQGADLTRVEAAVRRYSPAAPAADNGCSIM